MLSVVQKEGESSTTPALKMTTVRRATVEDLSSVVNLAHEMYLESTYQTVPFNRDEVAAFVFGLINNPKCLPLLCFHGSEAIGMLGLTANGFFFSPGTKVVTDFSLFVTKKHRGGLAAVRLIRAGSKWAREVGANYFILGATALHDNSRVYQLYEALGFKEIGRVFSRRTL